MEKMITIHLMVGDLLSEAQMTLTPEVQIMPLVRISLKMLALPTKATLSLALCNIFSKFQF